jgi:integrase/recombinase XerD
MKGCRALSDTEVPAVVDAIRGRYMLRDRALMVLGLRTGLRISELLSLRISSVWRQGRLLERVHVEKRHTKGRLEGKTLPIHAQAKIALEVWLGAYIQFSTDSDTDRPLFPSFPGSGKPLTRMSGWRIFKRALSRAGLVGPGLGCHVTRKTYAARMWEALGHDLIRTQAALCHKSVSSTAAYVGVNTAEVEAAIMKG